MSIAQIFNWFKKAVPTPQKRNFTTQFGVHVEEFAEMLETLEGDTPAAQARLEAFMAATKAFADDMKAGEIPVSINDPVEFADAICDQVVTGVGTAYMANIDIVPAVQDVADSNDSKFDEKGEPVFHSETRKILKSALYRAPHLEPFVAGARFIATRPV